MLIKYSIPCQPNLFNISKEVTAKGSYLDLAFLNMILNMALQK